MRRAEDSRAVYDSFILEARGRSREETYDVQEIPNMDKLTLKRTWCGLLLVPGFVLQ